VTGVSALITDSGEAQNLVENQSERSLHDRVG
jgi:hypothetical protein